MDSFFGTDIMKLAELLKTNENDSDTEDEQCVKQPQKIGKYYNTYYKERITCYYIVKFCCSRNKN